MSRIQANIILLLAAALWGLGDIAHKTILNHLDPLAVVGLTCLIGGIFTLPFARFRRGGTTQHSAISLCRVTVFFLAAQYLQQVAYATSSVTTASFLISATSVLTPVLAWLLLRTRPDAGIWIAAGLTFAGSLLLSGGIPGSVAQGDLIAVLAAVAFALWTIEIGRHVTLFRCDFATATVQFFGVALIILPFSAAQGDLRWASIVMAWPELLALGLFSMAIAFHLQIRAQRHTSASHAAIIVSAESVFAAIAAAIVLDERLSPTGILGGILVLAGVVVVAMRGSGAKDIFTTPAQMPAGALLHSNMALQRLEDR